LRVIFPDIYQGAFTVGSDVRFYEGGHLDGSGTALEIH
jgi:hypothetical protein